MARIAIIGAGHNGLVCANYLARAGHSVTLFEQHRLLGGAARTDEETFPGYKLSSCSYVCSLFMTKIVQDLGLKKHGYEIINRDPALFKPTLDGRFLSLGRSAEENFRQMAKFSQKDAEMFSRYEADHSCIGEFVEKFLLETPPSMPPRSWADVRDLLKAAGRTLALGPRAHVRLLELVMRSPQAVLSKYFESDVIRSAMLPDATIGSLDISALLLILHQFMGEAGGARGVWGFQRGGMGGISKALAQAGKEYGVEIRLNEPVESIRFSKSGVANGVYLESGEIVSADVIVSNATPHETFTRLVPAGECPTGYLKRVESDDYTSGVMKVNAILRGLPDFRALRGFKNPAHFIKGTIHISPSTAYIERALSQAKKGESSKRPLIEMTIPSIVDDTLAPVGHHVMSMFVQYTPYYPKSGEWTPERKERYFRENILGAIRPFVTNIDEMIIDAQILAPPDLYEQFRLTGGNIFHGGMKLSQMYFLRHLYRTPKKGLYLCGAGTHPGGGVMGACGHNAAREINHDLSR